MSTDTKTSNIIVRVNPDDDENRAIYLLLDGIDPNDVVEQLLAEEKVLRDWTKRTADYRSEWEANNPSPILDRSEWREIKKWKAGLRQDEITQEMRDEREATKAHNQALSEAHTKLMDEWHERRRDAMRQWIADQDNYPEQLVDQALHGWMLWRPEYEFHVSTIDIWGTTNAETGPTTEQSD